MALQTWQFDPTHSTVGFTVRHMVVSKVRGEFRRWSGQLVLDDGDWSRSTVEVQIDAASIDTHEEKRDAHLRSPDFFDVEKYPQLTFRSTRVEGDAAALRVTGALTIHGITREAVLEVEPQGRARDPWGGERTGFSAHTTLDRRDFGLTLQMPLDGGGVVVGDKIQIAIEIEAVRAVNAQAA